MVSHDTFKNAALFALVIVFLYFLFRDKIHAVVEEPFEMPTQKELAKYYLDPSPLYNRTIDDKSGAMSAANTGNDRSLIKSDDEMGILSTCQQNSGGELVKNCSEIQAYNYDYDTSFDKFLRPTSFDQPNFLKSKER
jgi:hypothetical protein